MIQYVLQDIVQKEENMYHIKSDRRSQRTAEEICRGLLECLAEKPLSSVTVTDIHRATSISRATFYRLFDNVDDVLCYLCEKSAAEEFRRADDPEVEEPQQFFTRMLEQGLENSDLFRALMENSRYDLVFQYAERRFRMLSGQNPEYLQSMDGAAYEYIISGLAMNMVSTMITWHRRGRVDPAEEITQYMAQYLRILTGFVEDGRM